MKSPCFQPVLVALLVWCASTPFSLPLSAADAEYKKVLFLVGNEVGIPEIDAAAATARSILQSGSPVPLTLYTEYLDQRRFGSGYLESVRDWYSRKYRGRKPDVIIAAGDVALDFLLKSRSKLWPDVPVVFAGVDERALGQEPLGPGVTGALFHWDIKPSLELALRLLPETTRVALVAGATPEDRFWRDIFKQELARLGKRIDFDDLTRLPMGALLPLVASLPDHTVVFYFALYVDGAGQTFVPSGALSAIARASNRPIFGFSEPFLGHGIVGGLLASYEEIGREAAQLALRILRGEPASAIPIQRSTATVLAFDWRQLRKWGIDEGRLGPRAVVRFRAPSLWEQHRWLIIAILSACVIQALLIAALLYDRRWRRRATTSLDERLRFESLVADVSAVIANLPVGDVDEQIRDCLGRIVRFLSVDRGSLWQLAANRQSLFAAYSWRAEGVDPAPSSIRFKEDFPFIFEAVKRGSVTLLSSVHELPPEAAADRASMKRSGARSLAAVPLVAGGKTIGVLTLSATRSECRWPAGLSQRLQTLAGLFAAALARQESESAVRYSEAMHTAVLASLEEYVTVLDRDGVILRTSPTSALTVSATGEGPLVEMPVAGRDYLELWRPSAGDVTSDATQLIEAVESVLENRQDSAVLEYRDAGAPEGRWFEIRVQRLDRPEGGAVVSHLDITRRKRTEFEARRNFDEIAHLNRMAAMGELAASLAHEINQPLTAILSNAQAATRFLSGPPPDLEQVRECLTDIAADDRRAGEVIKRLRALLKKGESESSVVDLNEVVGDAIRLVGHDALLRKVSVVFEPSQGLPSVLGDRVQLYQVALNLIMNGLEATAERPRSDRWVLVRTLESESGVELSVEDSGEGIAESNLARVFEPFFSTKPEGLGMGLSISRSIVQAHGGRIWAENSSGGGAIFKCVLPVARQTMAAGQ